MGELAKLSNIGSTVERQLEQVGICTAEALRQLGSREAWLRIQAIDESACIHRLLALEGAIRGVRKTELPEDVRAELREFYHRHKK